MIHTVIEAATINPAHEIVPNEMLVKRKEKRTELLVMQVSITRLTNVSDLLSTRECLL